VDTQHRSRLHIGSTGYASRRTALRAVAGGGLAAFIAAGMRMGVAGQEAVSDGSTLPPVMAEWVAATESMDVARAAATYAPDAEREVVPVKQIDRGREEIRSRLRDVADAFADGTARVPTVFAVDDQAAAEWIIEAHYTGELPGYPAGSGQPITLRGVSLMSLADGAIARERLYVDVYGMLVQLGLAPAPASDELAAPVGKTFVGPTSDPETLVAIVLRDDPAETAVAYLCRGPELNIWFSGTRHDDALALVGAADPSATTPNGSAPTMTGRLTPDGISGEARLTERTLSFLAIPAAGIAGLYVAERDEIGKVRGTSSTGATLVAQQVAAEEAVAAISPYRYRIVGAVTAADGREMPIEIPACTNDAALFRWVALADGRVSGAGKRRREGGSGFVGKSIDI
jgi:steroid delta-isomerase-like uncharacterized protein